ncbi:MAG: AbiEi antitoxin N-terminal domain-containing protein [Pseudomonadota bacterium]
MTSAERLAALARSSGEIISASDAQAHGISRVQLSRMVERGQLCKAGRGLYFRPEAELSALQDLAFVGKRVPKAVVCLISALRFHEITSQQPYEVWVAVAAGIRSPNIDYPPTRVVHFSAESFDEGAERHTIDGVEVRVYSVEKTVVDCFKFRNKIGLDVALEALHDAWQQRRCDLGKLRQYAALCRMTNVMQPYLESLLHSAAQN